MDLITEMAQTAVEKGLKSRWMMSPQDIAQARGEQEQLDIKRNDLADRPAKKRTKLPVSEEHSKVACFIFVAWGEAPTSAKKWVHQLFQNEIEDEAHWVSWLRVQGTRRRVWRPSVWVPQQWTGCEGRGR